MSAAILCGGKSRRMGRDKALLPAGKKENKSFVGQLTENLAAFDDLWLSIGREESYPQLPVRKISDRYPDAGPMGGLESALTVCRHDILFVTAVDMPFADADLAEDLYGFLREDPSLDAILMVDGQGRKQHLLGLYRKRVLPLLRERLEERQQQKEGEAGQEEEEDVRAGRKDRAAGKDKPGREDRAAGKDRPGRRDRSARKDRTCRMKDFLGEIQVAYVPAEAVRDGVRKTLSCNSREEYENLLSMGSPDREPGGRKEGLALDEGETRRDRALPDLPSAAACIMTRTGKIPVISVTGWSGSGKTTFLEKLLPCLKARGLRVACLKHDAHHFEVDKEGKDSYRLTRAGADMTGLFSADRGVWMENRPSDLTQMLSMVHDVDLLLLEGGSQTIYPKILVYREALGRGMRVRPDQCLAVISDDPAVGARRRFTFEETDRAAAFIDDWSSSLRA